MAVTHPSTTFEIRDDCHSIFLKIFQPLHNDIKNRVTQLNDSRRFGQITFPTLNVAKYFSGNDSPSFSRPLHWLTNLSSMASSAASSPSSPSSSPSPSSASSSSDRPRPTDSSKPTFPGFWEIDAKKFLDRCYISAFTGIVGTATKFLMQSLNTTTVKDGHKLTDLIDHRAPGQALITVSNHVTAFDDPLALVPLLHYSQIVNAHGLRWTLGATDRCFTNRFRGFLCTIGKVLPVVRGDGLHQYGMNLAIEKLKSGQWVHIFPEGTRSGEGQLLPLKRGVARLVASLDTPPLIVPIYHVGLTNVQPKGTKQLLVGKQVFIQVGDPVPVDDLFQQFKQKSYTDAQKYDLIIERVYKSMSQLRQQVVESAGPAFRSQ